MATDALLGPVQPTYTTQPFSCTAGDLLSNTTYYFQLAFVDNNNGVWTSGKILKFKVLLPAVVTQAATSITSDSAVLNGTINPNGSPGAVFFFWGTSPTNLGNECSLGPVQPTYTTQPFSCTAGDLLSNTTYYFQLAFVDNNNGVWTSGSILNFITP